jgi:non-ribosomal peptide synthetase component E (peptide arylation enzyme)
LTEFPIATSATPDDPRDVLVHTVGRLSSGVELRAQGVDGAVIAAGREGELVLRGPQQFLGYLDATLDAAALTDDGWFRTGDLGHIDLAGNVHITGRLKEIVIRNAENISALEVEEALHRHSSVAEAAVIGLPDSRTGERVCAVVVLRPGTDLQLGSLRDHCRGLGLAAQKCPEQLVIVEQLPRNSMGKVQKPQLRQRILEAHPSN